MKTVCHFRTTPPFLLVFIVLILWAFTTTLATSSPPLMTPDLELSATASNNDPAQFDFFSVTFTLHNTGNATADNIVVNIPQPAGEVVIQGSDPYTASQGSYNTWSTFDWTVGSLAANTTATITINYFNLTDTEKHIYGQVTQQSPSDLDSAPNNGTPPSVNEDDEAAVTINGPGGGFCSTWSAIDSEVLCAAENTNGNYDVYLLTQTGNNTFVNKYVINAGGDLLSSSPLGLLASDSVLIQGNQLIKKLASGTIEWQKTIPQSVLDDYPALTQATELNDGTIVLGGIEKHYSPSWPPFDSDSLYLVKLSSDMVFQDAVTVFAKSNASSPTYIAGDSLYQIIPRADGGVTVLYTQTTASGSTPNIPRLKIASYDQALTQQTIFASSSFVPLRFLETPCGLIRVEGEDILYSPNGDFEGDATRWFDLDDLSVDHQLVIGSGFNGSFNDETYRFINFTQDYINLGYTIKYPFQATSMGLDFVPGGNEESVPLLFFPFEYAINAGAPNALIFYQEDGALKVTSSNCVEEPPCDLSTSIDNIQCHDNGTPNDPMDDTWSFELVVNNSGGGNAWEMQSWNTSGEYGIPETIDNISISISDFIADVRDVVFIDCNTTVSATAPPSCATPPSSCANNLLENPGFEDSNTSIDPWTVDGIAPVLISSDAYSGSNAALMSGSAYAKIEQTFPAVPGEEYTLSAQIKAEADNYFLRLKFFNTAGQNTTTMSLGEPATGQYQENAFSGTIPSDAATMVVSLLKVAQPGNVWADEFCLTVGQTTDPCNPDLTPPVISGCPSNINLSTSGSGENVTWTAPTATDACSASPIVGTHTPGDFFPLGSTTVIYTASDASGNSSQCSFTITITAEDPCNPDVTPPVLANCPSNITVVTTGTGENINWTPPTATDNCSTPTVSGSYTPGQFFPIGIAVVWYTATDAAGNSDECSFIITVEEQGTGTCTDNLLGNPGYEDSNNSFPEWNAIGANNFSISSDAYSSNNALEVSGANSGGILQNLPATPGEDYTVSVRLKQDDNTGYLSIKFMSSTWQPLFQNTMSIIATGDYQELTLTETAPAGTAHVEVAIFQNGGTNGTYLVDEWCLTTDVTSTDPDLSISGLGLPNFFEVGKGGTAQIDVVNTSNSTINANGLLTVRLLLSSDDQVDPADQLIGYMELTSIAPGTNPIDLPYLIDESTPADQNYYLIADIDFFNDVAESNENNNSFSTFEFVGANTGLPCSQPFSAGNLTCSSYLQNGDLRVVTSVVNNTILYFQHIINEAGDITDFTQLPGGSIQPRWVIEGTDLVEQNALGVPVQTIPLSADLLAEDSLINKVTSFASGFVFLSTNLSETELKLIRTDNQTNVIDTHTFSTPDGLADVHSLVEITIDRFAVIYNEWTGFQASNKSTLVVMDPSLTVKSSEVISQHSGAVQPATLAGLFQTPCGDWTYRSSSGQAGGGGTFGSDRYETKGFYSFSNDAFVAEKTYTEFVGFLTTGGNQSFEFSFDYTGPAPDGGILTASRSYNYAASLPPFQYIPANDELVLTKELNGTIVWTKTLAPASLYPFEELVQIGDNYYLLHEGTYTNVDCDNNQPNNNTTGDPVDCTAQSDFPWHEWISRVDLNGTENTSGKTAYSDFTNLIPADLTPGQTAPIEIDVTFSYVAEDPYFSIFIDFDGDGLYEADEVTTGHLTGLASGSQITHTWSGQIDVPSSAQPGLHPMRVILQRGSHASSACGTIPFGEVEDYLVNISATGSPLIRIQETERLQLWPNPAQQYVYIDMEEYLSEEVTIEIVNNLGQRMYNNTIPTVRRTMEVIDLSGWKNGHYTVWLKPRYGPRRVAKMVVMQTY